MSTSETPWRVMPDGEKQWQGADGYWYPSQIRATLAGTPVDPALPPPPPTAVRPYRRPTFSGMATGSFIMAFFFWPVGIILGHVALYRIKRTGEGGRGLAVAGLIISYLLGALAIVFVVVAINHSRNDSGFNNVDTLQASVQQQTDRQLADRSSAAYDPGVHVTSTICARISGTQFTCDLKASDGSSSSVSITVSSDGSRWVTN